MIQLSDMKTYLRVDGEQDDIVLQHLMETAQALCRDILRTSNPESSRMLDMAMMYATAYLYEHRDEADHEALIITLRALLSGERDVGF
ncbi:AraC family transcriptional regulator [Veillonellaceae bacterium M2-4]|nr:AraC family transcriptional regulator [Veillonellaceae bacterium M2-4]